MSVYSGSAWRRLPLALAAVLAALGTVFPLMGQDRPPPASPVIRGEGGWGSVRVDPRSVPPGRHEELAERLYGWNCMPCHGADGKGDGPVAARLGLRPRDLTRGIFKLQTSHPEEMPFDDDLYRTISMGFPQASMPAFADFSVDERWSLVDYVKSMAPMHFKANPPKRRLPEPPAGARADPVRGAQLFTSGIQCSQCHGAQGRGEGPAASALVDAEGQPVAVPDLARGEIAFKGGARVLDVYRILSIGMSGTPMPSFLSLPEQDRWDVASFVTTLYQPVAPGEKLFLTRGCTHCHTAGKGRRVGPDLAGLAARRDRNWVERWLQDPPAMLATDPLAKAMARDYPVPMPKQNLTESEAIDLAGYLMTLPAFSGR